MKTYCRILLVAMATCLAGCLAMAGSYLTVKVHVVDENGVAYPGVVGNATFLTPTSLSSGGVNVEKRTDANGNFIARGWTITYASCYFGDEHPKNNYGTTFDYYPNPNRGDQWTTVTVKRVHHPCAMYHWYIEKKIPVESKLIGFDCVACDWVQPYGTGTNTDFLTALIDHSTQAKPDDIAFVFQGVGPNDGFIKYTKDDWSELKWIYEAPVDGNYTNRYAVYSNAKVNHEVDHNSYLVFRCRTVTNETGKIVSAHYGFIGGSIHYDYERKFSCGIYFNPRPNDPSIEYDDDQRINKEDRRR